MLDEDLAALYGVPTKRLLNEAVRRNRARFPEDFMFQLTAEEDAALRSQSVTSNARGRGGRRYRPYVFTEQGVAMLSSVLNSERAIAVNILIMRAFVQLRRPVGAHNVYHVTHDHSQACVHFRPRPRGDAAAAGTACGAHGSSEVQPHRAVPRGGASDG